MTPGDKVLLRDDLDCLWTVACIESSGVVVATSEDSSKVYAPESHFVPAPEGWRDPPVQPAKPLQSASTYAGLKLSDALATNDATYQQAMDEWRQEMQRWEHEVQRPFLQALQIETTD
jgi:hypothetical protein